MRQKLTTALEFIGAVLIVVGVAAVYFPAGIITAGVVSLGASYLASDDQ